MKIQIHNMFLAWLPLTLTSVVSAPISNPESLAAVAVLLEKRQNPVDCQITPANETSRGQLVCTISKNTTTDAGTGVLPEAAEAEAFYKLHIEF